MNNQPLISIIIPTYNRVHLIGETLDSVIAQTYTNWECIVVDDGSTDDTASVLQSYCDNDVRIQYHKRPNNFAKGACSCRNYGFEISKGTYINWFDDDDIMCATKLEKQINIIQEEDVDLVVCQTRFFEENISNLKRFWNKTFTSKYSPLIDFITFRLSWSINAPLWKKSFLEGKELFNVSLGSSQDWEFHSKLLIDVIRLSVVNDTLVLCRIHANRIGFQKNKQRHRNRLHSRVLVYKTLKGKQINHPALTTYFRSYFINQLKYIEKDATDNLTKELLSYIKSTTSFMDWYCNYFLRIALYINVFKFFGVKHKTFKFLLQQSINDHRK